MRESLPPSTQWVVIAEASGPVTSLAAANDSLGSAAALLHPTIRGSERTPLNDAQACVSLLLTLDEQPSERMLASLIDSRALRARFWSVAPTHDVFLAWLFNGGRLESHDQLLTAAYPTLRAWGMACRATLRRYDFAWQGEFVYADDTRLFPDASVSGRLGGDDHGYPSSAR
jgi:hypothetical protein